MYLSQLDPEAGVGAAMMSDMDEDEWRAHLRDIETIASWRETLGRRAAWVLHVVGKFTRPSPAIRTDLARVTTLDTYDPYVAMVSDSPVIRSMLTVLKWMGGQAAYEIGVHKTPESGLTWLEDETGHPLPRLREIHVQLHKKISESA